MYEDSSASTGATSVVFSLPRGTGRFYYVGLAWDNDPRDGSWVALLGAIAKQVREVACVFLISSVHSIAGVKTVAASLAASALL